MQLRFAQPTDSSAIHTLVNSAYRGESGLRSWSTEAHFIAGQRIDEAWILEIIADPNSRIVLAEDEGNLCGCVELRREGEDCYLGMLTVSPDAQRSGTGSFLLAESERIAREEFGSRAIFMTVISIRLELIAWYVKRGYSLSGDRVRFPYGNERFGQPLRDDLEFVVLRKAIS